jgi:transcriptional regulator with XRE-family HTH domain
MVINRIREVIRRKQAQYPDYYSPKAIAERLGVHIITVYKWESGDIRPNSDNLLRLARDLNVPADELREYVPDVPVAATA